MILNGLVSVCDKGAYRDDDDACVLCRNNTYKNVTGDVECSPCYNGTITLQEGAFHCGTFTNIAMNITTKNILNTKYLYCGPK